jgi:hypothetical protein
MLGTLISLAAEAPLPHPILKPQSDEIGSGRQLDHALVLQQEQRAAAIGRVVLDGERRALRRIVPALLRLRIDAQREVHRQATGTIL